MVFCYKKKRLINNTLITNYKILFLCKRNDKFSKTCEIFLKKKFRFIQVIREDSSSYLIQKKLNFKPDLILLFRNKTILKTSLIKKAKIGCFNFHPSTPKYRGIGGINYAIYNQDTYFGCTCHQITNEKIDSGKIVNFYKFRIPKKADLKKLLNITHINTLKQFKIIVPKLVVKKKLQNLMSACKSIKWSKKYYNKKQLEKFYVLKKNEKNIELKIKSTYLNKKFRPYYINKNNRKYPIF